MTSINLLPSRLRPIDRAPRGAVACLAAAIAAVVGSGATAFGAEGQLVAVARHMRATQARHADLEREASLVGALERQIAQARRREDSIFAVAESRIAWSRELQSWIPCFTSITFLNRMQLEPARDARSGPRIFLSCTAKGSDPAPVTAFRQRLVASLDERHDALGYIFDSPMIALASAPPGVEETHVLNFDVLVALR